MTSKPPLPSVKNFIIADQVFRQEGGKWCMIGIFDTIVCPRLPTLHQSLGLYLTVADAEGEYEVRVELEDAEGRCLARMTPVKLKMTHRRRSSVSASRRGGFRFTRRASITSAYASTMKWRRRMCPRMSC